MKSQTGGKIENEAQRTDAKGKNTAESKAADKATNKDVAEAPPKKEKKKKKASKTEVV